MPPIWIGLTLAFASAVVTNTAYSLEHDAAAALPPLSPRRPFRSAQMLLRNRRWLIAFGAESAGWLMYVAALRLAPLALVQAVAASGVAVLAFRTAFLRWSDPANDAPYGELTLEALRELQTANASLAAG